MNKIDYNLPEWAFLDAHSHLCNELAGRTLILHIRSASVIEIIDADMSGVQLRNDVLSVKFKSYLGENLIAVLHYCATLDVEKDRDSIVKSVINPCIDFYSEYSEWEDSNILKDTFAKLN